MLHLQKVSDTYFLHNVYPIPCIGLGTFYLAGHDRTLQRRKNQSDRRFQLPATPFRSTDANRTTANSQSD